MNATVAMDKRFDEEDEDEEEAEEVEPVLTSYRRNLFEGRETKNVDAGGMRVLDTCIVWEFLSQYC